MGKDSKHQRTKGGVQPSNASRAAKLLEKHATTGSVNSFLAASAEARAEYTPPNLLDSPVHSLLLVDDDLPPEVRLVFRKLLKKDGTTKIKALSELTQLIEPPAEEPPSPQQDLSNVVLPQWTKLYPKLSQDESRKVRELAQSTHTIVCKAVGRSLAKHLKSLMPYWFASQFDVYTPVATSAKKSFATVFPTESKRVDALKYCSAEIHNYLRSNFENVWTTRRVDSKNPQDEEADIRVVVSTIWCVGELVKLGLIEHEFLDYVFGATGLFWSSVKSWDDLGVVKKPSLDLLSTVLQSSSPLCIPLDKCTALLNSPQPDDFVHVYNLLQSLCLTSKLKPEQARSKLIKYANCSMYHQASMTQSLGPVLNYVLEHESNQPEFIHTFLSAMTTGINAEKSVNEKISLVRHVINVSDLVEDELLIDFLVDNLSTACLSDLPKSLSGKGVKFFDQICNAALACGKLDSTELGNLFAGLIVVRGSSRRVMFQEEQEKVAEDVDPAQLEIVNNAVRFCVSKKSFIPVALLSRKIGVKIWNCVDPSTVDLDSVEDIELRLKLVLDLISVWECDPKLLASLSNIFDIYSASTPELIRFLSELTPYVHITSIHKWVHMDVFTSKLHGLLEQSLSEHHVAVLLNLIERLNTPKLVELLASRLPDTDFSNDLAQALLKTPQKDLFQPLYLAYWDKYLHSIVHSEQLDNLAEQVCKKVNLNFELIGGKLDSILSECTTLSTLDRLVALIQCTGSDSRFISIPEVVVPEGVLTMLQLHYDVQLIFKTTELTAIKAFSDNYRVAVLKSLAVGKLALGEGQDKLEPLYLVLHAQAISKILDEVNKVVGGAPTIQLEFIVALKHVTSRLIESVHSSGKWKQLWSEVATRKSDRIWECKLPFRVLVNYCDRSELKVEGDYIPKVEYTRGLDALDQVVESMEHGLLDLEATTTWIVDLRNSEPQHFGFDLLWRNVEDKVIASKLALITLELLDKSTDQNALSTLSCWVGSWVNGVKYVEENRPWMYWVSILGSCVQAIGRRGRNIDLFNFATEYIEFLAGKVYGGVYSSFLMLNEVVGGTGWWGNYALGRLAGAVAYVPSNTLCNVEPDCMAICEKFTPLIQNGVTLPVRIAAYRVVRKVRYGKELPIVPPVVDHVIRELVGGLDSSEQSLVSYLMVWDALLRIQAKSNEFASYVRDQDHLLTPLLNTLFFSTSIQIDTATLKYFDYDARLDPFFPVDLLHLACSVLYRALRNLPYTVRWWWNNHCTRQRDRVFVEKFVVKHLSSRLADEELRNAQVGEGGDSEESGGGGSNVTVHCHSGCNELVAHYRIEETNVTLTISLPLNHPLGPVTVRISDKKLHAKISHLLNTRSHSLSAGLRLWKETLDSLYKDVDECAICFFILHHVTKQTPKLACKTCRKKFHAACLYKWFSTSNKSECPLCRNLF